MQWPLRAGTLVLAGQAAVCLTVAVRAGRELGQSLARVAPWWTLAFTAGVLVFAAAVPAGGVPRFAVEVILSSALMALAALNLALGVRVLPFADDAKSRRLLAVISAICVLGVTVAIVRVIISHGPNRTISV